MDTLKTNASLDALQVVLNDVLVQTGKAIRSTTKDGHGNRAQSPRAVHSKLPDSMRVFHSALDDLESEIIKAKSILQRDLSRLQMPTVPAITHEPAEAQAKSPMVIDIDSSPQAIKTEPTVDTADDNRSVAPFPDMGMDISIDVPKEEQSSLPMTEPPIGTQPNPIADMDFTAPVPIMDQGESDRQNGLSGSADAGIDGSASGLNFTTMQFSLAPPEDGQQSDMNPSDNFGLGVYDGAGGVQEDLSLSLLPDDNTNNNNSNGNGNSIVGNNIQPVQNDFNAPQSVPVEVRGNGDGAAASAHMTDEAMDNILNMDLGGDGNDFDFSLEGDSFNDLMNSHDEGSFDTGMEHGQFDEDFFGLSKPDGT